MRAIAYTTVSAVHRIIFIILKTVQQLLLLFGDYSFPAIVCFLIQESCYPCREIKVPFKQAIR